MDGHRRACSIAWGVLVVAGFVAWRMDSPLGVVGAWFAALPLNVITGRAARPTGDERLDLPLAYRAAALAAVVVPLAGALLATVPGASFTSQVCVPYFALIAFFGYRALVARGPRRALAVATAASLAIVPCLFVAALGSMGCKCGPYRPPHWTEHASLLALLASLLVSMALAGVAVAAFRPRDLALPEARIG